MGGQADTELWNPPDAAINPVGDHLGFLLRRCQAGVFDHFSREVSAFDLRATEFSVLTVVRQNRNIRPSRLGEMLGIKLANLSPLLDRLEERKLLVRRRGSEDQRAIELQLTAPGRLLTAKVTRAVDGHIAAMIELMGEADYVRLTRLLQKLHGALETMGG